MRLLVRFEIGALASLLWHRRNEAFVARHCAAVTACWQGTSSSEGDADMQIILLLAAEQRRHILAALPHSRNGDASIEKIVPGRREFNWLSSRAAQYDDDCATN